MNLTDEEKAVLDGKEGPARQKAMDLLVRYGEALGAECLVATNNVCGGLVSAQPYKRDFASKMGSIDAVFSEFNLDSQEVVEIPKVKAFSCRLIESMDPDYWEMQGVSPEVHDIVLKNQAFCKRIGLNLLNTCAPYIVGNVPVKGEHCAWMESSAIVFCNSALGGRTNAEGTESTGAAMLVGKIPCWGYHLDENRRGTHLVNVEIDIESVRDWGLLGYYFGEIIQEKVPVINGIKRVPNIARLKHCGAASASSGGVEMYHIVGITPEAPTLEAAFNGNKVQDTIKFGKEELRTAYENVTSGKDTNVDFVVLGCPHYTVEQVWRVCHIIEGKKVHSNTSLWIFMPRALKHAADRQGYTKILEDAGAVLMTDTCPALGHVHPAGAKVAATDSCKQAHYLPATLGYETWFGSMEDCVQAAITGKWEGEL